MLASSILPVCAFLVSFRIIKHWYHAGSGNMKIYSPTSIIFPSGIVLREYDTAQYKLTFTSTKVCNCMIFTRRTLLYCSTHIWVCKIRRLIFTNQIKSLTTGNTSILCVALCTWSKSCIYKIILIYLLVLNTSSNKISTMMCHLITCWYNCRYRICFSLKRSKGTIGINTVYLEMLIF